MESINTKTRPTFLTVICILTFIGSGLSLLSNGISLVNGKLTEEQLEDRIYEISKTYDKDGPEFQKVITKKSIELQQLNNENFYAITSTNFFVALLALVGAFMMFKLDRRGFGIYILAQIIPIVVSFIYFGNNIVSTITSVILIFISLIFIIMYAVNLKHMK